MFKFDVDMTHTHDRLYAYVCHSRADQVSTSLEKSTKLLWRQQLMGVDG
jgi:hypothetical protein